VDEERSGPWFKSHIYVGLRRLLFPDLSDSRGKYVLGLDIEEIITLQKQRRAMLKLQANN